MSSTRLAPNTSPAQRGADSHTPQAVVERFLTANDALDVDGMFAEIAPDAMWAFPTAPTGAPAEVTGKTNNRAFIEAPRPESTAIRNTHRHERPRARHHDRVIAHYASEGTLIDGSPYANTYLCLVRVRNGKIVHWTEFCDPAPLAQAVAPLGAHQQPPQHREGDGRPRPTSLGRRTPLAHPTRHPSCPSPSRQSSARRTARRS